MKHLVPLLDLQHLVPLPDLQHLVLLLALRQLEVQSQAQVHRQAPATIPVLRPLLALMDQ